MQVLNFSNEVVGSLSAAFSNYTNDPSKGNRITRIQGDQIGFAQSLLKQLKMDTNGNLIVVLK